jgi:cell division protein YceG involved in septum cleavage
VAAVIYNRLHEGMPLGIDATTRFATGNYESPLTESELASESPYNTRTHSGLPPGPIGNPGLAAIEAAAHPGKVGYLFYVTKPGACNELTFAKTEAEFEHDVSRYNSAREAAGGNSPTTCP